MYTDKCAEVAHSLAHVSTDNLWSITLLSRVLIASEQQRHTMPYKAAVGAGAGGGAAAGAAGRQAGASAGPHQA